MLIISNEEYRPKWTVFLTGWWDLNRNFHLLMHTEGNTRESKCLFYLHIGNLLVEDKLQCQHNFFSSIIIIIHFMFCFLNFKINGIYFLTIAIAEKNHVMPAVFVALCHHFFSTSYNFKFDNIARGKDTRRTGCKKKMIALKVD